MNSIIAFFKDIFTISDDDMKVGLSQYKVSKEPPRNAAKKVASRTKKEEIRLSDLMRRSY